MWFSAQKKPDLRIEVKICLTYEPFHWNGNSEVRWSRESDFGRFDEKVEEDHHGLAVYNTWSLFPLSQTFKVFFAIAPPNEYQDGATCGWQEMK